MLIAVGSVKGSPGATSFALALAVRWPAAGARPVVIELDPSGGDIGTRWQTHDEPGLAGLVVAAQSGPLTDVAAWTRRLAVGAEVVVAPPGEAAAATVTELCHRTPKALAQLARTRPVLADLGRLDPQSPALPLLDSAHELLLVATLTAEGLRHLRSRVRALAARCPVRLVLVGDNNNTIAPSDVASYLNVGIAAVFASDPASGEVLAGRAKQSWGWTRRPMLAAARTAALGYPLQTARPDMQQAAPQEALEVGT